MLLETARQNMISQQIRASDVLDSQILELIAQTPREHFVPKIYHLLAYTDTHLPIGHNQVMLSPREEALILQALAVKSQDKVLEVGTGMGYFTALLAKKAQSVVTFDIYAEFIQTAQENLKSFKNITYVTSDILSNIPVLHFEIIFLSATLPYLPNQFKKILTLGGRILALIGKDHCTKAVLLQKKPDGEWTETYLFETDLPSLTSHKLPKEFVF